VGHSWSGRSVEERKIPSNSGRPARYLFRVYFYGTFPGDDIDRNVKLTTPAYSAEV